jgi:pyruvate dehydrogenase E1 component beta subunit
MPYSAADAKGLLKTAIRDPNPVIFLENEILYGRSFDVPKVDDLTIPFGKARIWREGTDVTIVSFGIGMTYALEAAEELAKDGIEAEVIDLRTLRPIDYDTVIASVMKTNRCVTVEEGFPVCSIGNHLSGLHHDPRLRLSRRAGPELHRARTCRCPMRPISKSSR